MKNLEHPKFTSLEIGLAVRLALEKTDPLPVDIPAPTVEDLGDPLMRLQTTHPNALIKIQKLGLESVNTVALHGLDWFLVEYHLDGRRQLQSPQATLKVTSAGFSFGYSSVTIRSTTSSLVFE
jgi:hypothetical protein